MFCVFVWRDEHRLKGTPTLVFGCVCVGLFESQTLVRKLVSTPKYASSSVPVSALAATIQLPADPHSKARHEKRRGEAAPLEVEQISGRFSRRGGAGDSVAAEQVSQAMDNEAFAMASRNTPVRDELVLSLDDIFPMLKSGEGIPVVKHTKRGQSDHRRLRLDTDDSTLEVFSTTASFINRKMSNRTYNLRMLEEVS